MKEYISPGNSPYLLGGYTCENILAAQNRPEWWVYKKWGDKVVYVRKEGGSQRSCTREMNMIKNGFKFSTSEIKYYYVKYKNILCIRKHSWNKILALEHIPRTSIPEARSEK